MKYQGRCFQNQVADGVEAEMRGTQSTSDTVADAFFRELHRPVLRPLEFTNCIRVLIGLDPLPRPGDARFRTAAGGAGQ